MTAVSVFTPPDKNHLPGAYPGYWHEMHEAIGEAIGRAQAGPCSKSKRVAWVQSPLGAWPASFGVNGPPQGLACGGDQACRDACAKICTHAEERVVLRKLRENPDTMDVFHLEVVDGVPVPFDRAGKDSGPSCITCARLMLAAEVRLVWLYGVAGWQWWASDVFYFDTLRTLQLLPAERIVRARRGP